MELLRWRMMLGFREGEKKLKFGMVTVTKAPEGEAEERGEEKSQALVAIIFASWALELTA